MDRKTQHLETLCEKALYQANLTLNALGSEGHLEIRDSHTTDISTRGDREISQKTIDLFRDEALPATLWTEEFGRVDLAKNPKYTIAFDDIDGTDNYFRGRGMLPHTSVISLFDSPEPRFEDALVAGIIEHNTHNLWQAFRGEGAFFNGQKATTTGRTELDRRASVIIDHYMSAENISKFHRLYPLCWVKDFGSGAFNMAGVASGMFDAYLSSAQKFHELGAGYLLAKEVGAFISDLRGAPIDSVKYDFNSKTPLIIAATEKLGRKILSEINLELVLQPSF